MVFVVVVVVAVVVVVVNWGSLPGRYEHESASDFQRGHAIHHLGPYHWIFCVPLLSISRQHSVCFNHKGSFISIITTCYAGNASSERGTRTVIDPATF